MLEQPNGTEEMQVRRMTLGKKLVVWGGNTGFTSFVCSRFILGVEDVGHTHKSCRKWIGAEGARAHSGNAPTS